MMLKFKPEHFGRPNTNTTIDLDYAADRAQEIFDRWLKERKEVFFTCRESKSDEASLQWQCDCGVKLVLKSPMLEGEL